METNKIILGDCLEEIKKFPDNFFDSIVTDPPYELGFMGKDWDKTGIANNVELWKECLRVLKPGGYLLAFSRTRTYHRMANAVEDAGFEIRDMIEWVYGCVSEDTLILTDKGCKNYNQINIGDNIYSFVNGKLIKNKVKQVFKYSVSNEIMIHLKNQNTDQLETTNHKVLLKECIRKQFI